MNCDCSVFFDNSIYHSGIPYQLVSACAMNNEKPLYKTIPGTGEYLEWENIGTGISDPWVSW